MNMPSDSKLSFSITKASPEDLDELHKIERLCFGGGKAASRQAFLYRLTNFPDYFLKAEAGGKIAGFVNGCPSDQSYITDDLFLAGSPFKASGQNLLIFGLAVHPDFRRQGIAHTLMEQILRAAKADGKKRVSLTCEEHLIPFYEAFGYKNHGVSKSVIGGIKFFDMETGL